MEVTTSLETEVSTISNIMAAIFVLIMTIVPPGVRGLQLIHTSRQVEQVTTSQHIVNIYLYYRICTVISYVELFFEIDNFAKVKEHCWFFIHTKSSLNSEI